MNSNSYLGMALRAEIVDAEEQARGTCGTGPGAVRFISGTWARAPRWSGGSLPSTAGRCHAVLLGLRYRDGRAAAADPLTGPR